MSLTDQEQKNYLDKSGNYCPKCEVDDLNCGSLETDGTQAWRHTTCNICNYEFTDIYTLTGVEEKT